MNKQLKRLLLSSALLISSQVMASTPVFQVIASLSNITMGPSASATLDFTATNNTAVALKVSNLQAFGNLTNVQSSVTADTCTGSTIASNGSCTSTVTITAANILEESHGYVDLKVCIDNGAQCSASRIKPAITLDPSASSTPSSTPVCTGTDGACKVFVSSSTMKGDMIVTNDSTAAEYCNSITTSGFDRANCICTADASDLGYDGDWHAWLSDSKTEALGNIKYSTDHTYIRTDLLATLVATHAKLTSGTLSSSIAPNPGIVWTGTLIDGSKDANNCTDWSDASDSTASIVGSISTVSKSWTNFTHVSCNVPLPIYCFQG